MRYPTLFIVSGVGDHFCDDGVHSAFNFNCRAHFWDGNDCQRHKVPPACSSSARSQVLAGSSAPARVGLSGTGANWDCKWEIHCTTGHVVLNFTSLETEYHKDFVQIYAGRSLRKGWRGALQLLQVAWHCRRQAATVSLLYAPKTSERGVLLSVA